MNVVGYMLVMMIHEFDDVKGVVVIICVFGKMGELL
jgi:hypothetical protein